MNASGKSTLMKATGLCILLAQAGCFVPAKEMTLSPYQAIYTRILNQDNLFAGLSSFAVEMSELRDILRHANSKTMVLGDELCSGTESTSAQALVASGIQSWYMTDHYVQEMVPRSMDWRWRERWICRLNLLSKR
jgi:DNA mismatch repair protein MutS